MGLDDFERELAETKAKELRKKRDRSRSRDRPHREHRHRHHHSSRRHRDDDDRDERHRHKRSRPHRETSEERARRKRRERGRDGDGDYDEHSRRRPKDRRSRSPSSNEEERISRKPKSRRADGDESSPSDDEPQDRVWAPPNDDVWDRQLEEAANANLQRDSWMEAPSAMDVDYVQPKKREEKTTFVGASAGTQHALKIHQAELDHHLADLKNDEQEITEEPAQRDVPYTFGDAGSQWRLMKLQGVYRTAEETGRSVEEIALEKYGDLRDFDEAREEEIEMDRRKMYGEDYVGKEKPSGELYEERRLKAGIHQPSHRHIQEQENHPQGEVLPHPQPTTNAVKLNQTELNRLKAQMMKAKMKKAPNAAELEAEYNAALANSAGNKENDVVVLNAMDNRMLAGGRKGEVKVVDNKRGRERGTVVENDDMSIDDMVRQERRTKGQVGGEGMLLAEKIAKDAKFDVSLPIVSASS